MSKGALSELIRADLDSFRKFLENMPPSEKRDTSKNFQNRVDILGETF